MKKVTKIGLGIATIAWPVAYVISILLLNTFFPRHRPYHFGMLNGVAILYGWTLVAIYEVHLFRSANIEPSKKNLWAALLLFGNIFVMPFYWYFYIWRSSVKHVGATQHPL